MAFATLLSIVTSNATAALIVQTPALIIHASIMIGKTKNKQITSMKVFLSCLTVTGCSSSDDLKLPLREAPRRHCSGNLNAKPQQRG
jgi:hypothetical protein